MLTNFECNEAKALRESIAQSIFTFVLNPTIKNDMERLEELESKCEHKFENGFCIYCGKEK